MTIYHILRKGLMICLPVLLLGGCKKLIDIPNPKTSITTEAQFSSNTLANSAIASLYFNAYASVALNHYWVGFVTQSAGLSADELVALQGPADAGGYVTNSNTLSVNALGYVNFLWNNNYFSVYMANAAIPALAASTGISDSVRTEYTGEAKFMRALSYFYLNNLFGNVPMALSTDYNITSKLPNASQDVINQQMIQDLKDAIGSAAVDFSIGNGERTRATKWAAMALLARVYLYKGDYPNAEAMADSVIAQTQYFRLVDDLAAVFNKNSTEAILQFEVNSATFSYNNATPDGLNFLPVPASPLFPVVVDYLSPQMSAAFEPGDQRHAKWVTTFVSGTQTLETPYKYTVGKTTYASGGPVTQYYMVLRLAEQYLIRAEARLHNNNLPGAKDDINAIRLRAGLGKTAASTTAELQTAIMHERQVELFAEWGHRWFDLKRTGQALSVLSAIPLHAAIDETQLLYPIPANEVQIDPNLRQNPGY